MRIDNPLSRRIEVLIVDIEAVSFRIAYIHSYAINAVPGFKCNHMKMYRKFRLEELSSAMI